MSCSRMCAAYKYSRGQQLLSTSNFERSLEPSLGRSEAWLILPLQCVSAVEEDMDVATATIGRPIQAVNLRPEAPR